MFSNTANRAGSNAAFIEFQDVGGRFDREPATATLYYVDGWKV